MKKFVCMNCGKKFEIPEDVDDPVRCPYCGAGPGMLVRIYDEKSSTPFTSPQNPAPYIPPSTPDISNTDISGAPPMKRFMCFNCKKIIEIPYGVPKPVQCPYCGAPAYMIHRIDGGGRGRGRGGMGWGRGGPGRPW